MEALLTTWLESLSNAITANLWLAPVLALLAGVLTSLMPCSLSTIPLIIGYVGGTGSKDTKRAFRLSLVFAGGMALTFTTLGVIFSQLGRLMQGAGSWWYLILGVLMLMMALQIWGVYNFIPSTYAISKSKRRGYIGALLAGVLGGLFSSPCATPVLVVLLAMVAQGGNMLLGIVLLLLYSIGHSVLILIAGTSVGFVQKLSASEKYGRFNKIINIALGAAILLIGLYLLYLAF